METGIATAIITSIRAEIRQKIVTEIMETATIPGFLKPTLIHTISGRIETLIEIPPESLAQLDLDIEIMLDAIADKDTEVVSALAKRYNITRTSVVGRMIAHALGIANSKPEIEPELGNGANENAQV